MSTATTKVLHRGHGVSYESWREVPLHDVLIPRQEKPDPNLIATGEIPIVAKIAFDTGKIDLRTGTETKTDMILIRPGDLVVSGINAAKGAIAIFSESESSPAAATIHYGAYSVRQQ